MTGEDIRLVDYADLQARGIRYTKRSLWRLEREGRFPKRVTGAGRASWVQEEVEGYLRALVAARDGQEAAE